MEGSEDIPGSCKDVLIWSQITAQPPASSPRQKVQRRDQWPGAPPSPEFSLSNGNLQQLAAQLQQGTYLWARDFQSFVRADVWLVGWQAGFPASPSLGI